MRTYKIHTKKKEFNYSMQTTVDGYAVSVDGMNFEFYIHFDSGKWHFCENSSCAIIASSKEKHKSITDGIAKIEKTGILSFAQKITYSPENIINKPYRDVFYLLTGNKPDFDDIHKLKRAFYIKNL